MKTRDSDGDREWERQIDSQTDGETQQQTDENKTSVRNAKCKTQKEKQKIKCREKRIPARENKSGRNPQCAPNYRAGALE